MSVVVGFWRTVIGLILELPKKCVSDWMVEWDPVVAALVCWPGVGLSQFSNQQELTHLLSPAKVNQKRFSLHRVMFHSPIVRICFSLCAKISPGAPVNP